MVKPDKMKNPQVDSNQTWELYLQIDAKRIWQASKKEKTWSWGKTKCVLTL